MKHLLVLAVLLAACGAGAQSPEGGGCYTDVEGVDWCVDAPEMEESMYFINTDETAIISYPCITTEFCGDPEGDSDVRCVRATVCGEAIR